MVRNIEQPENNVIITPSACLVGIRDGLRCLGDPLACRPGQNLLKGGIISSGYHPSAHFPTWKVANRPIKGLPLFSGIRQTCFCYETDAVMFMFFPPHTGRH